MSTISELYVHKIVLKRGYLCEKSETYVDIETGISREIDLVAYKHGTVQEKYLYELNFIIECKKAEKPLVILCDGIKAERYEHLLGNQISPYLYINSGVAYSLLHSLSEKEREKRIGSFSEKVLAGYSIVPAFGKSDETYFKKIMGLAKANDYFRNQYYDSYRISKQDKDLDEGDWLRLQLPILVVDAPLYTVYLNNDGELDLEETNWGSILVRLPWAREKQNSGELFNIQVIKKEFLDKFFSKTEILHEYISRQENVYFSTTYKD